jgi:hypothetical protein
LTRPRIALLVAAALFVLPSIGIAMAGKFLLFSDVSGVVLDHGKPVAGAEIVRDWKWKWNDDTGSETARTDAAGRFKFGSVSKSSLLASIAPHEPYIVQKIMIRHAGREYQAWGTVKGNYRADGEIGKPIRLVCRLDSEPANHGGFYGICTLED